MVTKTKSEDEKASMERLDVALKQMLNTPPEPHDQAVKRWRREGETRKVKRSRKK